MQSSVPESYLETEAMTATPQKRQLMLIEGAIRFIEQARRRWQADEDDQACECLVRAQKIVGELLAALDHQVDPDLTKQVAALYVFVFRTLVEANLHRDQQKLDDALRVLEPQREAWQGVCKELERTAPLENEAAVASLSRQEPAQKPPSGPDPSADSQSDDQPLGGFSMEA